jgi:hypothetical protein
MPARRPCVRCPRRCPRMRRWPSHRASRPSALTPSATAARRRPSRRRRHRTSRRSRAPRTVHRHSHIRGSTASRPDRDGRLTTGCASRLFRGVGLRSIFRCRRTLRRRRPINKPMLTRIVSNRRISVQRDHPRRASSPNNRAGDSRRRSGRYHRRIRKRRPRRRFHHLPTLPGTRHGLLQNRATGHRKNSPRQIDWLFSSNIQRMHRHHSQQSVLRTDEYSRHRPERHKSVKSTESQSRRP